MNNIIATIITFAIALGFLRLMDFFAQRGWLDSRLSRKLIPRFSVSAQGFEP